MNFQPALAAKVMAGEKTVTRRLVSDNPRSPWWRERCRYQPGKVFTVNPGRGKINIGSARVTRLERMALGIPGLDEAINGSYDANVREGFGTMAGFRDAFKVLVWRIEFEVVASAEVLVDTLRPELQPDARAEAGAEGVVQDDALTFELLLDFGVARAGAAGDVHEPGRTAVLEVDAPPVAVGAGVGRVAGVFDPGDLHGRGSSGAIGRNP